MSEKLVAVGFDVLKNAQKQFLSGGGADWHGALRDILLDAQLQNEIGEAALPLETVEIEDLPRGKVFIGIRSATRAHTHAWAARGEYEMAEGKEDKVPSEEGAPSEAEVQKFLGWVDRRDETVRPFEDEETDILAAVYERLRRLDPGAQSRILDYMRDRLAADARKSATED